MKESEDRNGRAKREAYLNQHIYGNANRLAEQLRESGALMCLVTGTIQTRKRMQTAERL